MVASEPSYPETLNLLAFAQQGDGEALLLFEGTLYVDVAVVATDGIMGGSTSMVALVIGWSYVLDVLEYRFPLMRRLLRDRETCLIHDGRMLRRNMRREMVTEEELMSVLRKEGIEDMAEVHSAFMEADGEISVVTKVEVENDSNDADHGVASSTFLA